MRKIMLSVLIVSFCVAGFSAQQPNPTKKLLEWADLKAGKGPVYGQSWSPDGGRIVTADFDQIRVWDANNGGEIIALKGHTAFIWGLSWSTDGKWVASASQDGTVRLWDMEDYSQKLQIKTGWAFCVSWLPNNVAFITGTRGGFVQLWDPISGQLLHTLKAASYSPIICIACSPDGKTLAAGRLNGEIELWDLESQTIRLSIANYSPSRCDVNGIAWSPDGSLLATAHQDRYVRIWDGKNSIPVQSVEAHAGWVRGLAWSPDGKYLASTGEDKRIYLWDTERWEKYCWEQHNSLPVWSISWSPDGKKVASGAGKYESPHIGATIIWKVPGL
jgi:WD40 repeat protein